MAHDERKDMANRVRSGEVMAIADGLLLFLEQREVDPIDGILALSLVFGVTIGQAFRRQLISHASKNELMEISGIASLCGELGLSIKDLNEGMKDFYAQQDAKRKKDI